MGIDSAASLASNSICVCLWFYQEANTLQIMATFCWCKLSLWRMQDRTTRQKNINFYTEKNRIIKTHLNVICVAKTKLKGVSVITSFYPSHKP